MTIHRGRSTNRYATVAGGIGLDYKAVAQKMTEAGFKMNHATAHNILIAAMEKFSTAYLEHLGERPDLGEIRRIARDPMFQDGLCELIQNEFIKISDEAKKNA